MKEEVDVLGLSLKEFYQKRRNRPTLWIHNRYGDPDAMDPGVYFRRVEQMPEIELFAMSLCRGKVLDVGAGVGAHVLTLQEEGLDVTALEISPTACEIMHTRGVKKIFNKDFFTIHAGKYDVLFFMMNGIGFEGTLEGLEKTLEHSKKLLNEGGTIIFDSSDVSYLYPSGRLRVPPYFGELDYQYQYGRLKGPWFKWLYIDSKMMKQITENSGWLFQVLYEDKSGHYLGGLRHVK